MGKHPFLRKILRHKWGILNIQYPSFVGWWGSVCSFSTISLLKSGSEKLYSVSDQMASDSFCIYNWERNCRFPGQPDNPAWYCDLPVCVDCIYQPPFSEMWVVSCAGELSGSSVAGSQDEDLDMVYRPRSSVSKTIKNKRRISWSFKNGFLESTGATPTFQNLLTLSSILWSGHREQTFKIFKLEWK